MNTLRRTADNPIAGLLLKHGPAHPAPRVRVPGNLLAVGNDAGLEARLRESEKNLSHG